VHASTLSSCFTRERPDVLLWLWGCSDDGDPRLRTETVHAFAYPVRADSPGFRENAFRGCFHAGEGAGTPAWTILVANPLNLLVSLGLLCDGLYNQKLCGNRKTRSELPSPLAARLDGQCPLRPLTSPWQRHSNRALQPFPRVCTGENFALKTGS
jgi:hypothetical protein